MCKDCPISRMTPTTAALGTPAPLMAAANAVAVRTDQYGKTTTYTVDSYGFATSETDALGNTTIYYRDGSGRVTESIQPDPDGDGPLGSLVTDYEYDSNGNCTQATYTTTQLVDSVEQTTQTSESWTYDSRWNEVTEHVDQMGRITLYQIDSATGLVTSMTQVVGQVDSPANGETDNLTTYYNYTDGGTTDTNGQSYTDSSYGSLPKGLLLSETDPLGHVTQYTYGTTSGEGSFGKVTSVTSAAGTADAGAVTYEYDARGNQTAMIDELGRRTDYVYNSLNELVETYDPYPDTTGVTVDDGDTDFNSTLYWNTVTGNGGNGDDYAYALPGDGSVTAEWTFAGLDPAKRYEVLVTWKDGVALTATDAPFSLYDGDTWGTLLDTIDVDQTGAPSGNAVFGEDWQSLGVFTIVNGTLTVQLTNDANGRVIADAVKVVEARSTTTYEYDGLGNQTDVIDSQGNDTQTKYCPLGVRTITSTGPDPDGDGPLTAPVTTYGYDTGLRLTSTIDPTGRVTEQSYDDDGRQIATYSGEILDNGGQGYAESLGTWTPLTTGYGGTSASHATDTSQTATATWTFDGLPAGEYDIYAIWTADTQNAAHAPFSVYDGSVSPGNQIGAVTLDESQAPNAGATGDNAILIGNVWWRKIGTYTVSGNSISVQLSDNCDVADAGKQVVADAVYVVGHNPTSTTEYYPGSDNVERTTDAVGDTTEYLYDGFGRVTDVRSPDGVVATYDYDAAGEVLWTKTYADAGDTYFVYTAGQITGTDADPDELRGETENFYNDLGQVYESRVYEVDPTTGDVGDYLASKTWYDKDGDVVKTQTGDGAFQKYAYDARGREVATFVGYDATESDTDNAAAQNVSGDTVIQQTRTWYDAASEPVATATYERFPDNNETLGASTPPTATSPRRPPGMMVAGGSSPRPTSAARTLTPAWHITSSTLRPARTMEKSSTPTATAFPTLPKTRRWSRCRSTPIRWRGSISNSR